MLFVAVSIPASAQDSAGQAASTQDSSSLRDIAQKSANPMSDVWMLITQNDLTFYEGDLVPGTKAFDTLKFQPVMPIPIMGGDWNLIFRPVVPLVSSPIDEDVGDLFGLRADQIFGDPNNLSILQDPFSRTNGLGDIALVSLLGPNRTDGVIWGAGITQIFPAATEDVLGQGKWQAGPAGVVARMGKEYGGFGIEHFNFGILAQQWWSYAGDEDRESTNQMDIQYFLNWRMNPTQLVGMTPNIRIDWDADSGKRVAFPVGLGTIGLSKIGGLPIRWGMELQYYVTQPDIAGPEWNLRFFIAPIISNPFKK